MPNSTSKFDYLFFCTPCIDTSSVTETNKLLMAGANVVYTRLGMKQRSSYSKAEPWWKKRIKRKIKQVQQDISRLERIRSDDLRNNTFTQSLKKKYNIARKGLNRVVEELKQRLTAQAAKLKRYEDTQNQYCQDRMFETNQKRLFEEMEGIERNNDFIPDAEESRELWNGIWVKRVKHNENAEWLKQLERDLNYVEKQDNVKITAVSVKKAT